MSFLTDGTHANLPSATVWPGIADPNLRKAFDVAIPGGKRIDLADHAQEDTPVSLPQEGGVHSGSRAFKADPPPPLYSPS